MIYALKPAMSSLRSTWQDTAALVALPAAAVGSAPVQQQYRVL
jgi:hypothetical protein